MFREKVLDGKVTKKARLVARGYKQSSLNEEVYAPMARMMTVCVLLSLYIERDWYVTQLDVSSAFLYGILDSPVYMYQPEGLCKDQNLVCKLNKSLYGLKQAPKCWNSLFHEKLSELGLKRSLKDPCLYSDSNTFLLIYVDDIILFSEKSEIEKIDNELYISHKELIQKVLSKFNMVNCRVSELPMQPKLQLTVQSEINNDKLPYRELVGCLMYMMLGTRPDLSFCVTYFSQFQNGYSNEHWNHLKNVLRYLKTTEQYGLKFTKSNSNIHITSYVDSDFANNISDRKSITGFLIKMNTNLIYWKTKKQSVVSLSSAESEYIALSFCVTENLFLAQMLSEILNNDVYPIRIFEDNQSCIKMASTLESKRTKHIDIRHHFLRDCIAEKQIELFYVQTDKQQADILTKQLPAPKFKYFRDLLNVCSL